METVKTYKVTVEVYTRAVDKKTALDQVDYTLHHTLALANHMEGFLIPDDVPLVEVGDLEVEYV